MPPPTARDAGPRPPTISAQARELIEATFEELLTDPAAVAAATQALPPQVTVAPQVEAVLASPNMSYRDGLVVQLAFWLAIDTPTDVTVRQAGGRGVSSWMGPYLAGKHIRARQDAFQNIGKNTERLDRGNFREFDEVLRWASEQARTRREIHSVFRHVCGRIAASARPVLPLPELDRSRLTFGSVCQLFTRLFATASGGSYEQFTVAALLHALIDQQALGGTYRVETKNLNASDRSSRTAGDVQILVANRIVEAIEVTANDWSTKLAGAERTIREYDLGRLTVIASGVNASGAALFDELGRLSNDLSVIEASAFVSTTVAALTRQGRSVALQRLYEFLDRYQPQVEIVNQYVTALQELGLCVSEGN